MVGTGMPQDATLPQQLPNGHCVVASWWGGDGQGAAQGTARSAAPSPPSAFPRYGPGVAVVMGEIMGVGLGE